MIQKYKLFKNGKFQGYMRWEIYDIKNSPFHGLLCNNFSEDNETWLNEVPSFFEFWIGFDEMRQFTGLIDKNGKEIYEGDIINVSSGGDYFKMDYKNFKVVYWEFGFHPFIDCSQQIGTDYLCSCLPENIEVINDFTGMETKE